MLTEVGSSAATESGGAIEAVGVTPAQPPESGRPVRKYASRWTVHSGTLATEPWMSSSTVNAVPPGPASRRTAG